MLVVANRTDNDPDSQTEASCMKTALAGGT